MAAKSPKPSAAASPPRVSPPAEALLEAVLDAVPDCVFIKDCTGAYLDVNQAMAAVMGRTKEEVVGCRDRLVFPEDEARWLSEADDRVIATGTAETFDHALTTASGQRRQFETCLTPRRNATGTVVGVIGVARDVTSRRELESRVAHASKLTLLGELAAGLAHEISQPLFVVRLMAEGGLDYLDEGVPDPERLKRQFTAIVEQADRINTIISHVRRFGRRDTEGPTPFDPVASTRSAMMMSNHQLESAGVCLRNELPESGPSVLGHPARFEQVIINLMTNAIDAIVGAEGRTVLAGMGTITVSALEDAAAGTVTVRIADDGPGIPPEVRERLFDPFFTTKPPGKGTGLGLSISLGIVAEMGGRIEVPLVENGTRIDVILPLHHELSPPTTAADRRTGSARRGRHVLVVDDDPMSGHMIAGFLSRRGFRVTEAGNGAQAMARFLDDPADAVITDVTMAGGDGNQLIQALRSRHADLPIVVVTGREPKSEPDAIYVRQANEIQRKPARLPALLAALRSHLNLDPEDPAPEDPAPEDPADEPPAP